MKRKIILVVSAAVLLFSLLGVCSERTKVTQAVQVYDELQEQVSEENPIEEEKEEIVFINPTSEVKPSIEKKNTSVKLNKLDGLYKKNNDLVGWINNGEIIDYPIVQCKTDSNYYLHRDFNKKESVAGCLYIPNDISIDDSIVLIYGHNMRNSTMFGSLKKYLNKDYFERHKVISLSSLQEEKKLEVLGVFLSQVYDDDYKGFKYYKYRGNLTEEDFNTYLAGIKPLMQVGDLSNVSYGDKLVELSTCNYHVKNGRLVVLCKQS